MKDQAKGVIVAGGAAFLASKFVFDKSTAKAAMYGLGVGFIVFVALQIKTQTTATATGVSKINSPELPETDNSVGNLHPETLVPLVFKTGVALNNAVESTLE